VYDVIAPKKDGHERGFGGFHTRTHLAVIKIKKKTVMVEKMVGKKKSGEMGDKKSRFREK